MADIVVSFDAAVQSLDALNAAAYRLIGQATCEIQRNEGQLICRLTPAGNKPKNDEDLRTRFLDLVTDENVRLRLNERTDPVRNLILSLAFGSLAQQSK